LSLVSYVVAVADWKAPPKSGRGLPLSQVLHFPNFQSPHQLESSAGAVLPRLTLHAHRPGFRAIVVSLSPLNSPDRSGLVITSLPPVYSESVFIRIHLRLNPFFRGENTNFAFIFFAPLFLQK